MKEIPTTLQIINSPILSIRESRIPPFSVTKSTSRAYGPSRPSIALTFQFTFKNILTPVWTVIVYSHENPPLNKTIIEINAFSGKVITEPYTENLNA